MPELPEVETVRKGLAVRLANFYVKEVEICRDNAIASPGGSKEFAEMMRGVLVCKWSRRGKYLIATLKRNKSIAHKKLIEINAGFWVVHLRMTGQFKWLEKKTPACPYTRVRLWNQEDKEIRFVDVRSFGQMWWIPPSQKPENIISGLQKLGPEPFSKDFNPSYLHKQLEGRTRPIKSTLLDQSVIAGVGNIYADESLFSSGILPQTPSGQLNKTQIKRLCTSLVEVLRISIGEGGTTFSDFRNLEGGNGKYGGMAWVYRRGKQPCRKCGSIIKRESLSGRGTHWCPKCQR